MCCIIECMVSVVLTLMAFQSLELQSNCSWLLLEIRSVRTVCNRTRAFVRPNFEQGNSIARNMCGQAVWSSCQFNS